MAGPGPLDDLDAATRAQLDGVVTFVGDVLGEAIESIVLFGSAVRGGLRSDSDLDILIVASRRLAEDERRSLIGGLLARSRSQERRDLRHLEVTVVAGPDIRPWRYPPPMELQYGDW